MSSNVTSVYGPAPPVFKELQPPLLSWISDENLALVTPLLAYWTMSIVFYLLDKYNFFVQYRIHTPEELSSRNKCTVSEVIRAVVMQHIIQTAVGLTMNYFEEPQYTGHEAYEVWRIQNKFNCSKMAADFFYKYVISFAKIFIAFFFVDTWQYTLHRIMHNNKFLYKHLHSVHHRLYVPYAFGALYNSLIEGFLLDTLGAGIAYLLTGLTAREAIIFYTFSTMKTVDDHCGYELPWDLFQLLFPNNAVYHDIHHQQFGIKTNFSQPFFIHWDTLFNTRYAQTELYAAKQKQIRLDRYKRDQDKKKQEASKNEKKDL